MGNQIQSEKKALNQSVNRVKQVLSPMSPRRKTVVHNTNPNSSAKKKVFSPAPAPASVQTPRFRRWLPEYPEDPAYSFSDFIINDRECLGEGSFACVKLALHVPTKKTVAVKIITKEKIPTDMHKYAINETKYLRCLSHQNIIAHYLTYEDAEHIYMFLEYSKGGDLYSLVESKGHLSEELTRKIMKQVIHSLLYCHENNICHRDIKLENILFSGSDESNIKIKLIDFGFASIIPSEDYLFQDFPGSMLYAAPELLEGTPYNARKSDVYSLGVLFYIMIYGRYPFFSESNVELLDLITQTRPEFESTASSQSTDLITRMLTKDPSKRISMEELLEHPWFNRERANPVLSPLKTKVNLIKTEVAKHSQNLRRYSLSPKTTRRNRN